MYIPVSHCPVEEIPEAFDSCGTPTHLTGSSTSGRASALLRKASDSFRFKRKQIRKDALIILG